MQHQFDELYWNNRWQENKTQWDIGAASPALVTFMKQQPDKSVAVLIPGCGNAYEAEALLALGFSNITLLDISEVLAALLQAKWKDNKAIRLFQEDFFKHNRQYDIILEQTFFCALNPTLRPAYTSKMSELLKPGGQLAGLLFNRRFSEEEPPFGGSLEEYQSLFGTKFEILKLEPCYNSILPRTGSELFFHLKKKENAR
jgi:SAM-dependent methyltransferase